MDLLRSFLLDLLDRQGLVDPLAPLDPRVYLEILDRQDPQDRPA